jgi:tetratricopeptide (TPR) repeat protein
MGMASDGLGDHPRAIRYHQEALAAFERLESRAGRAYALSRMSMSAYFLRDYAQALQWGEEGFQAFTGIGHRWGICTSLCALGFASIGLGDTTRAREYFRNALGESRPDQIVPQSLYALIGLACCLAVEGEIERPLRLLQFVRKHPETPTIYLEQASPWTRNLEKAALQDTGGQTAEIQSIEEVTGWFG